MQNHIYLAKVMDEKKYRTLKAFVMVAALLLAAVYVYLHHDDGRYITTRSNNLVFDTKTEMFIYPHDGNVVDYHKQTSIITDEE